MSSSRAERAEATTRRIETQIREAVPYVDRVLIHAETMERTHLRYAVPLDELPPMRPCCIAKAHDAFMFQDRAFFR